MIRVVIARTVVAVCLFTSVLNLAGCKQESVASRAPLPVRTALVRTITIGNGVRYSASIVPYSQVNLAFQSSGYIDRIRQVKSARGGMRNIDPGDFVRAGTVLAVVDQQTYRDKIAQANAQIARAQAEYEKAKLSFDRVSALYSTQSATKPDYDSAKAQMDSTAAAVSGAKADLSEGQTALARCSLAAPFDGWIVNRTVDKGSFVGPATNGFTIANTRTVKAVFGIPDISMDRVRMGQDLSITTDALAKQFRGHVTSISPAADAKSRVFSVEVSIANPRDELKSGMIASLTLNGAELPQAVLAVPLSSVIRNPNVANGFAVMTIHEEPDGQTAHMRPVELGDTYGNVISAKSGLQPGDRVITTGVTLIKDGDPVRVIP